MNRENICCFTGHRHIKSETLPSLSAELYKTVYGLIQEGYKKFLCGGALGFDTLAAQAVLQAKEVAPHISLHMVLPCKDQSRRWTDAQRKVYEEILSKSDEVSYIAEQYEAGCMHKRNRYLIEHAGCVIAYMERATGGTHYTVNYAQKLNIPIIYMQVGNARVHQLSLDEYEQSLS
ncbi:MAG: DUF1273 domain-containing protein [Ruminococcaceae bacterium]|nr:DUF1273 domain-containing protein [Oscillospiraceae bacterium]